MKGGSPQKRDPIVEPKGVHERIDPLSGIGRTSGLILRTQDEEEAFAGSGESFAAGQPDERSRQSILREVKRCLGLLSREGRSALDEPVINESLKRSHSQSIR